MASVFITRSVAETERAGALLAPLLRAGDVVALAGDLGAGKTHLVQGVARGLGVTGGVTSPTFNLLLVHRGTLPLYHFDLYRLDGAHELEDIGFFETIEADGVSFIEWGDRFPDMLPDDHMLVTMERGEADERRVAVEASGPRGRGLAHQWLSALGIGGRP
jgi:tRNA threonylcarbamoyladenosine biosynthesis protein TsaE